MHPVLTSADIARLPLEQVAAVLRKTTEVLATELAAPTETAPDWSAFEWDIARAAAAMHGVSPLLSGTLRWRGPERWERFLSEQRHHTLQRHHRIMALLADIGSRAVRDGIAIVPLKGAALHDLGIYQPGERPMADLDLLVASEDVQAMARLLGDCGYRGTYTTWKHWVFESVAKTGPADLGEHAGNPIKIELHTKVAERFPAVDRDISGLVFPSRPTPGLNRYPSLAALMVHVLTHAAGAMCPNGIRLLHLHDIALLSSRMSDADWDEMFRAGRGRPLWWLSPPLTLAARYFSTAVPRHVVARAQADCPWLVRRRCGRQTLSEVSLSNLWIQAFPGIQWSQSTVEILSYVRSRISPGSAGLAERGEVRRTNPTVAQFSWSHLPQWRRMLGWAFGRPPRLETLSSVCAALGMFEPQVTQQS